MEQDMFCILFCSFGWFEIFKYMKLSNVLNLNGSLAIHQAGLLSLYLQCILGILFMLYWRMLHSCLVFRPFSHPGVRPHVITPMVLFGMMQRVCISLYLYYDTVSQIANPTYSKPSAYVAFDCLCLKGQSDPSGRYLVQ